MLIEKNSIVVFAGDSVTDADRNYDRDPGGWDSWGHGYVTLINDAMTALAPQLKAEIINSGVNGDDIKLLAARYDHDVLRFKPDYVTVMVGINDVWRHFDREFQHWNQPKVEPDEYRQIYHALIDKTKPTVKRMIIMSPFMWELNHDDPMRHALLAYQKIGKELAAQNDLMYIDAQAAVDDFLHQASYYVATPDRVHPSEQGAMVIAKKWLDAVGFDWSAK